MQKVFDQYRDIKGGLIPVLQEAQDIYGYLPKEVLQQIAKEMKLPYSNVFGVCTFYAQFHLKPRPEHHSHLFGHSVPRQRRRKNIRGGPGSIGSGARWDYRRSQIYSGDSGLYRRLWSITLYDGQR